MIFIERGVDEALRVQDTIVRVLQCRSADDDDEFSDAGMYDESLSFFA